jgi:hypothetical protein
VYKVGNRVGTAPAGEPAGPFGNGGLRTGQRLLWFWCVLGAGGSCQRTLEALPARDAAAPGEALAVTVRGYDDNGRGVAVEGATVRLGTASAVTDAAGRATLTVPAAAGPVPLEAEKPGLVRALPREVTIG